MITPQMQQLLDQLRETTLQARMAILFAGCALLWPTWVMLSILGFWGDLKPAALGFHVDLLLVAFMINYGNITLQKFLWPLVAVFLDLLVAAVGTWCTILALSVSMKLDPIGEGSRAGTSGLLWLLRNDSPLVLVTALICSSTFCFLLSLVCSLCLFMQVPDESMLISKAIENDHRDEKIFLPECIGQV